jgi:hypothetical protein
MESVFSPIIARAPRGDRWAAYLTERYAFLNEGHSI